MENKKNVVEKTETTPEEKTKENEEKKTLEKTEGSTETKRVEVDYKAELEKAQGIISHKESVIKAEKEKNVDLKEELEQDIDSEELEDKIKTAVESQIDGFKKGFVSDTLDDEIDKLSRSPEEKDLIKFHLEHSVKLSGTTRVEVKEAVKTAWLKANEKKILSTNKELAEALIAKATTKTTATSAGEKVKQPDESSLSAKDKAFIDRYSDAAKNILDSAPVANTK